MDEHGQLGAALSAVGLVGDALEDWRPLGGGLSNRSYRVEVGGDAFAVRLRAPGAEAVLDLDTEHAVLRAVAAAGIGPDIEGVDAGSGALVTKFVAANSWSQAEAREPANVERAAALLKRLHDVAVPVPAYEPAGYASRYCRAAEAAGRIDGRGRALADELASLVQDYKLVPGMQVLCHNDLVPANILDNGALMLVDFEYAVSAPALVDLASLAAMNGYDERLRERLLAEYYGAGHEPVDGDEFAKLVRMNRLLAYFWALSAPTHAALGQRAPFAAPPDLQ